MKKLKLQRETIGILGTSDLSDVHGGAPSIIVIQQTRACPVMTNGCTGGCNITISPGPSVINPSGG